MPDFAVRATEEEIMDDLSCSGEVVDQTLRELEVINRLLGGNHVSVDGVSRLLKRNPDKQPALIADLGCGGGDILKLLARWFRRRNIKVQFLGIDANENIVAYARRSSKDYPEINYEAVNIFSDTFNQKKFDIVVATLFFHHFSSEQLADFLRRLKQQTSMGIVINDIHRHWLAYHLIRLLTKFFSGSSMVKNDAPLSVLRAFSKRDWQHILERAGITDYSIRWMFAFRWQVIIHC